MRKSWLGGLVLGLMASGAAQAADPIHVRGTVATVDGAAVTVKDADGKSFALKLDPSWHIAGVVPASMADIKQGTFIGTANQAGPDGNAALEVVVFPEAMRGSGEGDYAWDLKPKSAMTNATVSSLVEGTDGRKVTLSFKGGQKTVTIPPSTPIVTVAPGTAADVVPGAKVFIGAPVASDGTTLTGGFIAVGKNGLTPPM